MATATDVTLARLATAAYSDLPAGVPVGFTPVPAEILAPELPPGATYVNGVYRNGNAAALVASGTLGGAPVLVLAFRGSDEREDSINSLQNTAADYPDFAPLVSAVEALDAGGGFGDLVVTGHSLGGALTQVFMAEHPAAGISAATFGSPGAPIADGPDPRTTNFVIAADPAVFLGENRAAVGEALRDDPLLAGAAIVAATDVFPGLTPLDAAAALPSLTADYENRGNTVLLPAANGSLAPLASLDAVLEGDPAEHRVENYVARLAAGVEIAAAQTPEPLILWRNADGSVAVWNLAGGAVAGAASLANPGAAWNVAGSGDFNADTRTDILFRATDGALALWTTEGGRITSTDAVTNPGAFWSVAGTGDFNTDFHSDILWRGADGAIAVWTMDGARVTSAGLAGNPGAGWNLAGTGDFNADGRTDLLLRSNDGAVALWTMEGATVTGSGSIANPGAFWSVAGTGDVDGDGRGDILWRGTDGTIAIWNLDGATVTGATVVANPGAGWNVAAMGDTNGDSRADILLRSTGGALALWTMEGPEITGSSLIAGLPADWQIPA